MSIPKFQPPEQSPEEEYDAALGGDVALQNVPRSGGEKNYVNTSSMHP